MRKLIMWNIITLDGYFEGTQNWDLPFHLMVWGEELEQLSLDQLVNADYLLFGRVTYEGMAAHWTSAEAASEASEITDLMNSIPKLVVSKTMHTAQWNNTRVINDDVVEEIKKLKNEEGKDIYVFGSAKLSETLIKHNLFDEYRIAIAPVLLGNGTPLFKLGMNALKLSLLSALPLKNGGVLLKYVPNE
jgi:dihydrofolate reductase